MFTEWRECKASKTLLVASALIMQEIDKSETKV